MARPVCLGRILALFLSGRCERGRLPQCPQLVKWVTVVSPWGGCCKHKGVIVVKRLEQCWPLHASLCRKVSTSGRWRPLVPATLSSKGNQAMIF